MNYYALYIQLSSGEISLLGVGQYRNVNDCVKDFDYEITNNITVKQITQEEYKKLCSRICERNMDYQLSNK